MVINMIRGKHGVIYSTILGASATVYVSLDITNRKARKELLADLKKFDAIDNKRITVNLVHKQSSKEPLSIFKEIVMPETDISRILGIADSVITSQYTKSPPGKGIPFPQRVKEAKPAIDASMRSTVKKAIVSRKHPVKHNRESYMNAVNKALDLPIMRNNDLYAVWRNMVKEYHS